MLASACQIAAWHFVQVNFTLHYISDIIYWILLRRFDKHFNRFNFIENSKYYDAFVLLTIKSIYNNLFINDNNIFKKIQKTGRQLYGSLNRYLISLNFLVFITQQSNFANAWKCSVRWYILTMICSTHSPYENIELHRFRKFLEFFWFSAKMSLRFHTNTKKRFSSLNNNHFIQEIDSKTIVQQPK